jgi:hypothetical protein
MFVYRCRMANLTPEQRDAQRKIVGTLNVKKLMWFEPNGDFCIWRDERSSTEYGQGIPELSKLYDVLEIPYYVRVEMLLVGKKQTPGFSLAVRWDDLPALTKWAPSFQKQVDGVRGEVEKTRTSEPESAQ